MNYSTAIIRESECIGCTKCIQACPVDAIIGSAQLMHTVLTTECIGCGLCVEPCPVDCVEMIPLQKPLYDKNIAKERSKARRARLFQTEQEKVSAYQKKRQPNDPEAKRAYILEAIKRSRGKKLYD